MYTFAFVLYKNAWAVLTSHLLNIPMVRNGFLEKRNLYLQRTISVTYEFEVIKNLATTLCHVERNYYHNR